MALMKLFFFMAISQAALVAFILYSPFLLDVEPKAYTPIEPTKLDGALKPNELLTKAQKLFLGELKGPESFAVYNGKFFTGTESGHLVRIDSDQKFTKLAQLGKKCEGPWEQHVCGRPLGLRATKDKIYIVDVYFGLHVMDPETGITSQLLPGNLEVSGTKLTFLDHLDIHEATGKIYMTQMSSKWNLPELMTSFMEYEDSGRVLSYDIKTGKVEVLLDKMYSPNGLQISHDGNAILISETFKSRILKYELTGSKKGEVSVFANLPGTPDNIVSNGRGGYWVALVIVPDANKVSIDRMIAPYPAVRKFMVRSLHALGSVVECLGNAVSNLWIKELGFGIKSGQVIMQSVVDRCMILEMDSQGKYLRSLQSTDVRFCMFSEVLEKDGYLYLGSFTNNFLGKLKL